MPPRTVQQILDHADELATRFETAEPNPLPDAAQAAMTHLRDAIIARADAEAAVRNAVKAARDEGVSWALIGTLFGTTGEAARQRYGVRIP